MRGPRARSRTLVVAFLVHAVRARGEEASPAPESLSWASQTPAKLTLAERVGQFRVGGKLPVSLPGLYAYGHGLELPGPVVAKGPVVTPSPRVTRGGRFEVADAVVAGGVESRAFPGAVLAVGTNDGPAHLAAFGRLDYTAESPEVREDTIYDLASLTKIVVTTATAMVLVDEGRLDLERPVSTLLPGFRGGGKDRVTVWHLLTHSSGLDWWGPLYKELSGAEAYRRRIESMDLVYEPGTKSLYSDLGIFLLGEVLQQVAGESLEAFARRRILVPLGMKDTTYRPGPEMRSRIAPTEEDPWRGRMLRGEVHDENAFALGGVAPHAGLFGTAVDLSHFARMLVEGGSFEGRRVVSKETLERFTRRAGVPGSSRALGFDTPTNGEGPRSSVPGTAGYSSAGSFFSDRSFGHTGFTGTSIWIDPQRRLYVVLLTNRVHPRRDNEGIRAVRAEVADAVVRALSGATSDAGR